MESRFERNFSCKIRGSHRDEFSWDFTDISEVSVATSIRKVEKAEYDKTFLVDGGMP